jgi:hypothetical protein
LEFVLDFGVLLMLTEELLALVLLVVLVVKALFVGLEFK